MCKHGTDVIVRVKVPADLSSTGQAKWREFGIDSCIAPLVKALQEGGIDMRGSCCGHGSGPGRIDLADGRVLEIHPAMPTDACAGNCYSEFEEGYAVCSRHSRKAPSFTSPAHSRLAPLGNSHFGVPSETPERQQG